jgi:transposase InsO family protein
MILCARRFPAGRILTHSDGRTAELPVWLHRYNWHRPHGGLNAKTPISRLGLTEDNLLRLHS